MPAHSANLTVTSDADAGAGSLRQALADAGADDTINFAPALNGSTILLTSGELIVSRSVTILGPGANQLAINGNGTSRVFYFASGQTNLIAGLTITNGNVTSGFGGGIYSDRATLTVSNVILSGNSAGSVFGNSNGGKGGGIYITGDADTTLTLQGCIISTNSARGGQISFGNGLGGKGGGVFSDHAILIVSNVDLSANSAGAGSGSAGGGGGSGGGIYIVGDATNTTLTIQHCTLSGNSAESRNSSTASRGGGIYSDFATLTISSVTISSNSAVCGGGIFLVSDSERTALALRDCTISNNSARGGIYFVGGPSGKGGGIYSDHALLTVSNVTLSGNSASDGGRGGGIYLVGDTTTATLTLQNSTLSGNFAEGSSAGGHGGGIYSNRARLAVSNVTLSGNSASDGGGIYLIGDSTNTTLTLQNSNLSGNSAGGGSGSGGRGGGIYGDHAHLAVSNVTLSGNSASDGGGIYLVGDSANTTLTLQNSTLSGNSAWGSTSSGGRGGGIYGDHARLAFSVVTLSGNLAKGNLSGSVSSGGGIYLVGDSGTMLTIQNSTLNGNSAENRSLFFGSSSGFGGGIYTSGSASLSITHTLLARGAYGSSFSSSSGAVTNLGFNLSDDSSTTNSAGVSFATTVTNLFLAPLANNGGPTPTHALLPGSPAFNAGDPGFTGFAYDQRGIGFARVVGGIVDVGSFEVQSLPPTVNFVAPTYNSIFVVPQNIFLLADVQTSLGTISSVAFFQNGLQLGVVTNGYFYNWTNATPGTYALTAVVTNSFGLTATSAVVNVTVLTQVPLPPGSVSVMETNAQNGLLHQTVTVTNPTPLMIGALRLSISNLPPVVRVWNANGTNAGLPYLLHNQPVPTGGAVMFTIEYYVADGMLPDPTFIVDAIPAIPPPVTGPPLSVMPPLNLPGIGMQVEFTPLSNRIYYVQYSTDMTTWKTAQPAINGTGSSVLWTDTGPPKTESTPSSVSQRYYRVLQSP